MQLPDEAESAFQAALADAEPTNDLEAQAAAHAALWRVTGDTAERDEAVALYEALGDQRTIEALRQ